MKQWTINIEETQKFLNEEYPENRYLIEPRGYQKMTWGEEFWVFVNEIIDWRIDKDIFRNEEGNVNIIRLDL